MTKPTALLLTLAAVSCGSDGNKTPDAFVQKDAPPIDALAIPAAPTLGAQIDRMGRPAINTALNHAFDPNAGAGAAKDAYNQDEAMGNWPTMYAAQFAGNLAILDALDTGLTCSLGVCSAETSGSYPGDGCGNQPEYDNIATGKKGTCSVTTDQNCAISTQCPTGETCTGPAQTSYVTLAGLLADDELYLDTSKTTCQFFLAAEFSAVTNNPLTDCGGRAPSYDVMDTIYTMAAIGIGGFDATFTPAFGDGVTKHTDVDDGTFPFLGAPH
jgi:hypothetical protein